MHVPALYGASVNCSGNSSCDDCTCTEAFVIYPVLNVFVCKCNELDAHTVRLASVGLSQACPINVYPNIEIQNVVNLYNFDFLRHLWQRF